MRPYLITSELMGLGAAMGPSATPVPEDDWPALVGKLTPFYRSIAFSP